MSTAPTLEDRVEALERLVENQLGHAIAPNYLTADAQGNVGADFTGAMHAEGLLLDAHGFPLNVPDLTTDAAINWRRTSDNALVAQIVGACDVGSTHSHMDLMAVSPDQGKLAGLDLDANNTATASFAFIRAGLIAKQLLDGGGASDFLQLVTTANVAIAMGSSSVTFSASAISGVTTINHGLTRTPLAIALTNKQLAAGTKVNATAATSSTFSVQGDSTGVQTLTLSFYWVAIG
jgi:hypothetical protein